MAGHLRPEIEVFRGHREIDRRRIEHGRAEFGIRPQRAAIRRRQGTADDFEKARKRKMIGIERAGQMVLR